jgi:hypothetical protein
MGVVRGHAGKLLADVIGRHVGQVMQEQRAVRGIRDG